MDLQNANGDLETTIKSKRDSNTYTEFYSHTCSGIPDFTWNIQEGYK